MGNYYHISNLDALLRSHNELSINDDGEKDIREGFDVFLDFFVKLEYLFNTIKVVKKPELEYFMYYLTKAAENPAVIKYVKIYKFPFKGKLDEKLAL